MICFTPAVYPAVTRPNTRLKPPSSAIGWAPFFSNTTHRAGLRVSALTEEIATATDIVTANC